MKIIPCHDKPDLGRQAALIGAQRIQQAIAQQGEAHIIVATGASQFDTLAALLEQPIDWSKVTGFHLDEYIGLDDQHAASFRRYLRERFVSHVPLKAFHYVNGSAADPQQECARLAALIEPVTIDVAFIGIGENGHIAFNDPPADFETTRPYLVVDLDEACRQQQFGEGWFPTLDAVPRQAISMSVSRILKSRRIVCSVPDHRKAEAVRNSVEGPITPSVPGSALQQHPETYLFVDSPAASLLRQ